MLPPSLADEIRNEPKLSFGAATAEDFHGDIPGFQPFAQGSQDDEILQTVARKQLTKSLCLLQGLKLSLLLKSAN